VRVRCWSWNFELGALRALLKVGCFVWFYSHVPVGLVLNGGVELAWGLLRLNGAALGPEGRVRARTHTAKRTLDHVHCRDATRSRSIINVEPDDSLIGHKWQLECQGIPVLPSHSDAYLPRIQVIDN